MKGRTPTTEKINSSGTGWLEVGEGFNALKSIDKAQVGKLLGNPAVSQLSDDLRADAIIQFLKIDDNFFRIFL